MSSLRIPSTSSTVSILKIKTNNKYVNNVVNSTGKWFLHTVGNYCKSVKIPNRKQNYKIIINIVPHCKLVYYQSKTSLRLVNRS